MTCLSPETLAALATGRLSSADRMTAEAHLAQCEDCYEVFADILRLAPSVPTVSATPKAAIYWDTQRLVALAAAAVVVLVSGWSGWRIWQEPDRQITRAVTQLAQAVGGERSIEARVSGGFAWGPPPVTTRGATAAPLSLDAQAAALTIRRLATTHKTTRALDALGVAMLLEGDVEGAITTLEESVALDPADARALSDLAAARSERWRRTRAPLDATLALDAAERALLLTPASAEVRFNHALAVEALGLRDLAIEGWRHYLDVDATSQWATEARERLARLERSSSSSATAPNTPRTAPVVRTTGWSTARLGCWQRAQDDLTRSRELFTASHTAEAEQVARGARESLRCAAMPTIAADAQIAWTTFFQDRLRESLALADQILGPAEAAGDWDSVGRMHYIHGLAHIRAGRVSDSDARYEQAIAAFEQQGDHEQVAVTWVMRSEASKYTGDRAGMWERLARGLGAVDQLSPRRQYMTYATAVIGAERFGHLGAARFFADTLVRVSKKGDDPARVVGAYLQSANTYISLNQQADAEAVLARATAAHPSIADAALRSQYTAEIQTTTGRLFERSDPAKAITAYTTALDLFGGSGRALRRASLLLGRGRAHQAQGDATAAERDWREGTAIFEDQRPEIRDAQWRIDHFDQLWDLFRELIVVNAADPLASLEVAERFRGRLLLDAVARTAIVTPRIGDALYNWLPADVTVLAYTVLPDQLFRWTVTRSGVVLDRIPVTSAELSRLVDTSVSRVTRNDLGDTSLSALLLPQSLATTTGGRLVFLPDGPLYRIPFATLTRPGTTRLIIDDFVPMVAPSLTMLEAMGHRQPGPGAAHALFVAAGDAQPREGLSALPGVEAEVRSLRPLYGSADVLTGGDVTADRLTTSMRRADVIHFAGHAIADAVTPRRSRLLLASSATPSALTFEALRDVTLRPGATVVLSACDGARGRVVFGEGAVGLPHVLLAGGASTVVAALWQVDDAAPVSFWEEFHRRLRQGQSPALALAESQRISRRSGVSAAVWAAFEAVGGLVQS
jgi:tetratricopeptide (TPR) repeat protein